MQHVRKHQPILLEFPNKPNNKLETTFEIAILYSPSSKRLATSIYFAFDAAAAGDGCRCCKTLNLENQEDSVKDTVRHKKKT